MLIKSDVYGVYERNGGWDTISTRTAIHGYVCYYKKPGWKIEYASTHVGRKDW